MKKGLILPALLVLMLSGCSLISNSSQSTTSTETTNSDAVDTNTTKTDTATKTDSTSSTQSANSTSSSTKTTTQPAPETKTEPKAQTKPAPKPAAKPVSTTKTPEGKLILGSKEWVYLKGLGVTTTARIDTGATTSSISAIDIVNFERDGKDWVKFKLSHKEGTSKEIELPVTRKTKINQSNSDKPVTRYEVEAWIQVGDLKVKTPFTLTDRTHMDYGVLLGRSFSRDIAVVDVSRTFVQPKITKANAK